MTSSFLALFQSKKQRNLQIQEQINEQSSKWNLDSRLIGAKLLSVEIKLKKVKPTNEEGLRVLLQRQYDLKKEQESLNKKIKDNNAMMIQLKNHLEQLERGKIAKGITQVMNPKDLFVTGNHIIRMGQTFEQTNEVNQTINDELTTALSSSASAEDEEKKEDFVTEEIQKRQDLDLLDAQFSNLVVTRHLQQRQQLLSEEKKLNKSRG